MARSSPMFLVRLVLCVSTVQVVYSLERTTPDAPSISATSGASLESHGLESQSWQSYVRRRRMNTNYRQECLPLLDESDRDNNGVVDQTEFLSFVQQLGLPSSFQTLPLVLQSTYNFLVCQCSTYGGTDDCCLGSTAGINVQQVTDSDLYLHDVCYFTSRGISAALLDEVTPSPTPAPGTQETLAPSAVLASQVPTSTDENNVGGSPGSDDTEPTDSVSSGAIASLVVVGAVVFALLTALAAAGKCAPGQYKKKRLPDFHDSPFDDSEISYEEDDESYRYDTEIPLKDGSLFTPLKRKSSLDPPPGEYQHYDAYQEELQGRYSVQLGQRVDTDSTYSGTTSDESPSSQNRNTRKITTDKSGVVIHADSSKRAPLAPGEQEVYGPAKLMSYEASNIRSSESMSSSEQDSNLLFNSAAPVAVGVTMAGGMAAVASRNHRSHGDDTDDSSLSMTNQLEEQFHASGMESSDDAHDVLTQQAIQSNSRRSLHSQRQSDRELALAQASPDVVQKVGLQHVVDQRELRDLQMREPSSPSESETSSETGEQVQSNSRHLVNAQRQSDPGLQHVVDQRTLRPARTGESSSPSESETSSESDVDSSSDSTSVSGNSVSDDWSTSTSSSSSSSSTEEEAISITNYDPSIAMQEMKALETGMQVARVSSTQSGNGTEVVVGMKSNPRNDLEEDSGAFSKRSSISGEELGSQPSSSFSSSKEFGSRDGISELPSFEQTGREASLRLTMMESSQPSLSDMSRPNLPPDDSCSDLINSRPWNPAEEVVDDSPLRARAILSGTIGSESAALPNLDPIVSDDDVPFSSESEDETSSSANSGMIGGDDKSLADSAYDESGGSGAFDSYKKAEPGSVKMNGSHPPENEAAADAAEWAIARSLAMLKDSDNTNVTIAGDPLSSNSGGGYSTSRSDFDRGDLEESSV